MAKTTVRGAQIADGANGVDLTVDVTGILPVANGGTGASSLAGFMLTSWTLTAGNGMTGGGDGSANRTITLGTPGTLTSTTTNAVTSTSHTHALGTVDATTLGGLSADTASTANTVVARNSVGDIQARLFRSEYATTNSNVNFIMTQVNQTSDNYLRPSTPAQVAAELQASSNVGFRNIPQVTHNANYTLVADDVGKAMGNLSTSNYTYTVPPSVFGAGDIVTVICSTTGDVTISPDTGMTLRTSGSGSSASGSYVLHGPGIASIYFASSTLAQVSGTG